MGTVIRFPDERRAARAAVAQRSAAASIVILPVVRIERHDDEFCNTLAPDAGEPGDGRRSRRGRRS